MAALSEIEFSTNTSDKSVSETLGGVLQSFKKSQVEHLKTLTIPTRKTEMWKYSAKHLKLAETYPLLSSKSTQIKESPYELDCATLVISNGRLQAHSLSQPGLTIKSFSELNDVEAGQVILGAIANSDQLAFSTINAAYFENGVYINVSANTQIEKPLKIIFLHEGDGCSFPRIYVNVEPNASLTLVEEVQMSTNEHNTALLSSVSDLNIAANARVNYLRMNLDAGNSKHIGATGVKLHRDAYFRSDCLALGSELARHDLNIQMLDSGAECSLNCVCITRDKQHFDMHTQIEHIAPNCTSNETYRCIADNKSHIVFNGRIHIHPNAQKSLGALSNKNLLLSSEAEIDSKPELEIYADDVKCAHGTTIGQLDETELYYLKTRGISHEQAKLMLTLGFVLEIVRAAPVEEIAQFWEQRLTEALRVQ